MLDFLKVFSIFLEQVILFVLLLHQACLVKQIPLQNRLKHLVNRIVLDFTASVPGFIITLRSTWVDVRREKARR